MSRPAPSRSRARSGPHPGAVVIAGTGLEGEFSGIDEDERRL
jgi:hypothetical protein